MPTTRLASAVTYATRNSFPSVVSKSMPSCVPEKLLCEDCGKGFRHAAVLRRHRSLHKKDDISVKSLLLSSKTFPCKACGKVFKNKRTFGCHRCNNVRTKSMLNNDLKHETALNRRDGSRSLAGLLKHSQEDKNAIVDQSIPVAPIHNSSYISEGYPQSLHSRNFSTVTVTKNIQNVTKITTKNSPTLMRIRSKTTRRAQLKKDIAASKISTVYTKKLQNLTDIDIKSSCIQTKGANKTQSEKCKAGSKTTHAKNIQSVLIKNSPASEKMQSETVPKIRKKRGRKPSALYTCKVCHKDLGCQSKLQKHATLHDPTKPFGCDVCGKFFDDARFVKTHRTLHEKKSRKECDICGKVFNERIFFDIHRLTHVEQKPFRCEVCEDIFKDKTAFLRHSKGHKARTKKVAERFLSMKEVLKQKLEECNRQS